MTRNELEHKTRLHFENDTYYSSDDIVNSIQDGYDECCGFSGLILKATTLPYTALLSYYDMLTLIPDYIGVVAIFNSTIKRWMLPTSMRKLDGDRIDWETSYGTPYYFCPVSHRYVAIYKKPLTASYGNMYVFYRAAAPALGPTDTVLIPEDYNSALEDYVRADLWEQNQEWGKAATHLSVYQENLEALRVWVRNKRLPDRLPSLK